MTLQKIMQRDWDICHQEERESIALKLDRNGTLSRARRKDWHSNFDGLNTTRRESVWQSAWEVIGGNPLPCASCRAVLADVRDERISLGMRFFRGWVTPGS